MKTLQQKAEAEVREYSDAPIIYLDSPIPKNHLFAVRGEHCDFYETSKYVMVYLKPDVQKLQKKLERLEARYEKAKERSLQTFRNLGWGAGMRRTKLVSYAKEDSIYEEIKAVKYLIEQLTSSYA
jgi:hypothetical protein